MKTTEKGENMKKQKEDFVTRAEFEELRKRVIHYQNDVKKALEDSIVYFGELEAIRDQLNGRPVNTPGEYTQALRKERGLKAITGKAEKEKKAAVLQMVKK